MEFKSIRASNNFPASAGQIGQSKNRFCMVKSLDGQAICPVVYAGKEKMKSFKF